MYWIGTLLKKILGTMYWIGTFLFAITLPPSIKDVCLWHGIVLTCLGGGWAIIILRIVVLECKTLHTAIVLECKRIRDSHCNKISQKVWDNCWICLVFTSVLGLTLAITAIGIGIICVKYF